MSAEPTDAGPGLWVRRAIGAALIVLATVPIYNVLARPETGRAGWLTRQLVAVFASLSWSGSLLVLVAALIAARFVSVEGGLAAVDKLKRLLLRLPSVTFAALTGLFAALLTALFSRVALGGKPNMIDAIVQVVHARFLAAGRLTGPADGLNAFWHIQNSVITDHGWVSQYPPGHILLIAAGMMVGAAWLVGPLLIGVLVFTTTLLAERVWPNERAAARLAGALTACSTFIVCIGASYLNHVPTAALLAIATYCVLRARQRAVWAVLAGLAVGGAFTMRPLTALAVALGVGIVGWLDGSEGWARGFARVARLGALAALGAAAPLAGIMAYNAHFFGDAFTFGYNVALGPRMGLGFGVDPWGNTYGVREAIGYTSSDLTTLGVALLETPLSAVLVVGLLLMFARRFSIGERVLLAWALAPVIANAFYWHHGIYMGPRMLYEAAPAWILLFTIALVRAWQHAPLQLAQLPMYSPRMAVLGAATFTILFGLLYLAPQRAASYGGAWLSISRLEAPRPPGASLVFVHDAWIARLAMQMATNGMRLDAVETAIRQNPTCTVQELVDAQNAADTTRAAAILARMDMQPRATNLPPISRISTGNTMRLSPGGRLSARCLREVRADQAGILDLAPLLWQGDLPGGQAAGALYVRDLGPAQNRRMLAAHPTRTPWLYTAVGDDAMLFPYAEGMRRLWGE